MNFQVPQFIEEKAKIVGPLDVRQFITLILGGGLCVLFYYIFNFYLTILFSLVVAILAVGLAFGRVNGQSIPEVLKAAFSYIWSPRIYTWKRTFAETTLDTSGIEKVESIRQRMGIEERLKSIALSVTTGKIFSSGKIPEEQNNKERFQVVTYLTGERKIAHRVDYR